jgi:hypothetical protein
VGPEVGGGAVTVTEAEAVAGFVPAPPVAVSVNVVVPTPFNVNGIPAEFTGLPSRATELPFSVRATPVAFCVCQLTVTVAPCCTVVGVTVIEAVGLDVVPGEGFGL